MVDLGLCLRARARGGPGSAGRPGAGRADRPGPARESRRSRRPDRRGAVTTACCGSGCVLPAADPDHCTTVQTNTAVPETPAPSVAVTVTVYVPSVVAVPETVPLAEML